MITENITSLLLYVCSDILPGIAWHYGDDDFIIRTFDFIARSDTHAHDLYCST